MEVSARVADRKRKNSRLLADALGQGFEAKNSKLSRRGQKSHGMSIEGSFETNESWRNESI